LNKISYSLASDTAAAHILPASIDFSENQHRAKTKGDLKRIRSNEKMGSEGMQPSYDSQPNITIRNTNDHSTSPNIPRSFDNITKVKQRVDAASLNNDINARNKITSARFLSKNQREIARTR